MKLERTYSLHCIERILAPRILISESYTLGGFVALAITILIRHLAPTALVSTILLVDVLDNALPVGDGPFCLGNDDLPIIRHSSTTL
jgi:hypothetical protein